MYIHYKVTPSLFSSAKSSKDTLTLQVTAMCCEVNNCSNNFCQLHEEFAVPASHNLNLAFTMPSIVSCTRNMSNK